MRQAIAITTDHRNGWLVDVYMTAATDVRGSNTSARVFNFSAYGIKFKVIGPEEFGAREIGALSFLFYEWMGKKGKLSANITVIM